MLSFVQSWFTAGANPVGVDFGTECLRLAQVDKTNGDCRLIAAASADVPISIRQDQPARLAFLSDQLRELWSRGNFRGRRAVLALPAAGMHVQHLRLPRMDDESIKKALPWESQGKLPIDPANALLRHVVAGEIYADNEPRCEVILMAARCDLVEGMLAAATRARLDVLGMNVEPMAILDCFLSIYRRKSDAEQTNCYVDIGSGASRAVITRGDDILFARNISVGGQHFSRAVAENMSVTLDEAAAIRIRSAAEDSASKKSDTPESSVRSGNTREIAGEGGGGVATLEAVQTTRTSTATADRLRIERAIRAPVGKLVEELSLCRRYHEATFPDKPIQRLIFVGGEARQKDLCRQIARELGIAAQVGDPMVRMCRTTDVGIESGIDRRLPQPAWAVAIGLSMGNIGGNPT